MTHPLPDPLGSTPSPVTPPVGPPLGVEPIAELLHELDTPLGVALMAATVHEQRLTSLASHYAALALSVPDAAAGSAAGGLFGDLHESTQLLRDSLNRAIAILHERKAPRTAHLHRQAEPLDFEVVLEDALRVPVARHGDQIAECTLDVEPNLLVQTEPNAWYQVISNLVSNSVLHGFVGHSEGGGHISVSARRIAANVVRVTYRDDGRGFSAQARAHAFVRPYSSRTGGGSSGLGLCIIRDLVRNRLHGAIALQDDARNPTGALPAPLPGATFVIDFPARLPSDEPTVAGTPSPRP